MNLAYRFSYDEFTFLAAAFSLKVLPPWLKTEHKHRKPEQVLSSLEKKDFVICVEDTYLPAPLIGFLFDKMTEADVLLVLEEYAFCYVCKSVTVMLENMQGERMLRLYPFEDAEEAVAYWNDCDYAQVKREILPLRETPEAEAAVRRLKQLWEAMN